MEEWMGLERRKGEGEGEEEWEMKKCERDW